MSKKQVVKFRGISYGSFRYADLVYCPNCKKTEVVPFSAAFCPICGEEVMWEDEDKDIYEVDLETLNENYDVVEEDAKLADKDLYME